jgi:hypothetical protein
MASTPSSGFVSSRAQRETLGQYEPHLLQQLPDLHIQQLDHLLVSSIALVDEDHKVFEAQLLREGKMLCTQLIHT